MWSTILFCYKVASSIEMNVLSKFAAVAMDFNGPPGLTHPLLVENYSWVDERLREMYNGYALTASNCDEYEAAGLLTEHWDWVDAKLADMCTPSDWDLLRFSCPAPLTFPNYISGAKLDCIEESMSDRSIRINRRRSESDVSDYEVEVGRLIKSLRYNSQIPSGKYLYAPLSKPFCNLDCEHYNYHLAVAADEAFVSEKEDSIVTPLSIFPEHYGYTESVHYVTDEEEFEEPDLSDYSDDESTVLDFCDSP